MGSTWCCDTSHPTSIVRVVREGFEGDSHSSEAEQRTDEFLAHVNHTIENNGSIEDLRDAASNFIAEILPPKTS